MQNYPLTYLNNPHSNQVILTAPHCEDFGIVAQVHPSLHLFASHFAQHRFLQFHPHPPPRP